MGVKQSLPDPIEDYQSFMVEDYRPSTITQYSKIVRHFLEWQNTCGAQQFVSMESMMQEYMNPHSSINHRQKDMKSVAAAIRLYYYFLTRKKLPSCLPPAQNKSIECHVDKYVSYLAQVAGLTEASMQSRKNYITRFLYYAFGEQEISPFTLSVETVQAFLATELQHLRPTSKKSVIGIIRSYFRYLQFIGIEVDAGVLMIPLSVPVWRLSSVPKTVGLDEINRIHASYDRNTVVGIRDYAIVMCFTELGLRAMEVAHIKLDDVNWREGTVLIRNTKTHQDRVLPLSQRIGEALVEYATKARPETSDRTLFVRFSHHRGEAMGREQIRGTIRRAYARAGMPSTMTGTHILRHSKAKELYQQGSSLKIIADILGHASIDTTVIYTKVDRNALQCVTCPWPEVAHD
ncbi:tyrosine-type recombinase/integrase [Desulfotomaculum varum]